MKNTLTPALSYHRKHRGKLRITPIGRLNDRQKLALAYTPGVAEPCLAIHQHPELAYDYTLKGRIVAIVTDGSAVLGLGNIGPEAALPVMEGKAALLYEFAKIEAFPLCLSTQDPQEIIETIIRLSPTFAAIMLEDISAPNCVLIERKLQELCNIPVFHDDQHGTAIVVSAAVKNACRYLKKDLSKIKIVVSGTGAAGSNVCRMLSLLGAKHLYAYHKEGVISNDNCANADFVVKELLMQNIVQSPAPSISTLTDLLEGADLFIGLSAPNLVTEAMVKRMAKDPILFALANPTPEIMPESAKKAGAAIIGTGRSDYPNQINNVLVFPGLMKGVLASKAKAVTLKMKLSAVEALSGLVKDSELSADYLLPDIFDSRVVDAIANAVMKAA
ncbi:MAG: NADP-dependent malic enzyme [Candidatus Izemoplasmatales bacterium]|nr:NADP-dependent malic enzyme [Candidatus Izemoplasmatales bacterium]MDD4354851.1 NADP-dependent malic enzyme [Candidatus Izemoplasmatales bacterium]